MYGMPVGDVGRRIRQAREALRPAPPPQAWLAEQLDVSQPRLSNWERGKHDPPFRYVERAAVVLNVSVDWLLGNVSTSVPEQTPVVGPPRIPVAYPPQRMRYAGVVPAGSQWGDPLASEEFVDVDARYYHAKRFATTIAGESCWPALQQGDTAIWHMDPAPPQGTIILAQRRPDCGCTVKQLSFDDTGRPLLVPVNPNYEAPPNGDGWSVIARLVAVFWNVDGQEITVYNPAGVRARALLALRGSR